MRYATLGLIKWLKYSPRKALRGKLPVRYQGLTLRFAVNVDFSFYEQILRIIKLTINKCNFWCCYLAEKFAFRALLPKNGDMQQKSGGAVGLLSLMMAIYISWCHSHIIMTL